MGREKRERARWAWSIEMHEKREMNWYDMNCIVYNNKCIIDVRVFIIIGHVTDNVHSTVQIPATVTQQQCTRARWSWYRIRTLIVISDKHAQWINRRCRITHISSRTPAPHISQLQATYAAQMDIGSVHQWTGLDCVGLHYKFQSSMHWVPLCDLDIFDTKTVRWCCTVRGSDMKTNGHTSAQLWPLVVMSEPVRLPRWQR